MQPKWNKYEAAILLEAVINVESKQEKRIDAIKRVSSMLRAMAISRGENIDDVYRNINGITFQFQSMEFSAFGKDSPTHKVGTKLFDEIVALRNDDGEEYQAILKSAIESARTQVSTVNTMENNMREYSNKVQFGNWLLKTGEKEAYVNWILSSYDKVSDYAIDNKKSANTVWEINNIKQYSAFVNTLQSFKFFRILHKDLFKFLQNNAKLYAKFLKEGVRLFYTPKIADLTEYVISDIDRELNASYPETFKQVYLLLKENDKHVYLTLNQILKASDTSKEIIVTILNGASW